MLVELVTLSMPAVQTLYQFKLFGTTWNERYDLKKNDDCWVRQKLENKLLGLRFSSPAGSESYSR